MPLVTLYNNPKKQGPTRVENHCLKLQRHWLVVIYQKNPLTLKDKEQLNKDEYYIHQRNHRQQPSRHSEIRHVKNIHESG